MSKKIVQLNEEVIKVELKELRQRPASVGQGYISHLVADVKDFSS